MAPKDIARSYPKRGLTADVGFRSEPKFCGDGAATFPTTSDYAQTAASASLALGETYTLCAWVRSVKPDGANHVVNVGVSGTIKVGIAFFGSVSNPAVYAYNGAGTMNTTGVFESDPHTWYHIAMVIKPGGGNSQIFINGIDRTNSHSQSFPLSGSPVLHIGGDYSASNGNWQGDLANVALFTSSLTEDQVRQAMRASDYASHAAIATLEAFYPLSSDFNDSTGNHNATASGSPVFRPNRPQLPRGLDLARGAAQARVYTGRGIDLDGSVDYLETTLDSALGSGFSVSLWFLKRTTTGSNNYLWSSGSAGPGGFISLSCTSTNALAVYDLSLFLTSSLTANLNQWHHAVVTVGTGANSYTVYLDGIGESLANTASPNITNGDFELGRYSSGSTHYHDGLISDVKVFDQVLTADQVKELYHYPEQVLPTGVSASNLIHRWALSDYNDTGGTGGRYFQDSAGSNAMEDKGSASMAFAQPVPCPQLGLQQSATRHFFTGASSQSWRATVTAPGTTATLSGWLFWGDSSRTSYLAAIAQVTDPADSFNIRVNTFGDVTIYKAGEIDSGLNVNEGEWNHIVVTTKSTSPYWRCWVNGVEASSPAVAPVTNITTGFVYPGSNSTPFPLNGFINDVAFWDSELDTPDVAALYNSGVQGMDVSTVQSANLKGWWKADDLTTFKDYSGNGADAIAFSSGTVIAASFPENASGSTLVGDFSMKRKGASILNLTGADDGTAIIPAQEAVYPKAGSANGYTIGFCYRKIKDGTAMVWGNVGASTNDQFMCFQQIGPNLRFNLGDGSSRPTVNTSNITDSDWHHYTLTISYATTPAEVKIYVDGAVDHSSTQSITGPPALHPMHLGTGLFDGQGPVGCFKFYQVALSADEVKRLSFSDLRLIKGLANE